MGRCDGEEEDEEKRNGRGGGALERAKWGWMGPRHEGGAELCQHM